MWWNITGVLVQHKVIELLFNCWLFVRREEQKRHDFPNNLAFVYKVFMFSKFKFHSLTVISKKLDDSSQKHPPCNSDFRISLILSHNWIMSFLMATAESTSNPLWN